MQQVNGLWIGGALSPIEMLCIQSFRYHGYTFKLWTYQDVANIPEGTEIGNANDIIPESGVFNYAKINRFGFGKGSYAGFSDIFRYKLLYEKGGIWVDMDISCLSPVAELDADYFFRSHHLAGAVGNVLKAPKGCELMRYCYERAQKEVTAENTNWMLPITILNNGIHKFRLSRYISTISNNDRFPEVAALLLGKSKPRYNWSVIHWMNEEFRRLNLPNQEFLTNSTMAALLKKYQIPFRELEDEEAAVYARKLSRWRYVWLSLKAKLKLNLGYGN
ncbi:MAG: glycosyltransferase [Chitinophagales bacterium]